MDTGEESSMESGEGINQMNNFESVDSQICDSVWYQIQKNVSGAPIPNDLQGEILETLWMPILQQIKGGTFHYIWTQLREIC